jgi:hypothetical protein
LFLLDGLAAAQIVWVECMLVQCMGVQFQCIDVERPGRSR